MRYTAVVFTIVLIIATTGCTVGPNYTRPGVSTPPQFRAADQPATPESLADTKWFDLFQDDTLKQLITTALDQNHDLRIAADRVIEARAQFGLQRSQLFPTVSASASFDANKVSTIGASRLPPGFNLDSSLLAQFPSSLDFVAGAGPGGIVVNGGVAPR